MKCTKTEKDKRIKKVVELLLAEKTRAYIVQYSTKTWGLKARQTDTYIQDAFKQIKQQIKTDERQSIEFNLLQRSELYRKAMDKQDFRLCLDILRDKAKLAGAYDPYDPETGRKREPVYINVVYEDAKTGETRPGETFKITQDR